MKIRKKQFEIYKDNKSQNFLETLQVKLPNDCNTSKRVWKPRERIFLTQLTLISRLTRAKRDITLAETLPDY